MFMLEHYVMFGLLALAVLCLTIFICKYRHAIEVDDVSVYCI